MIKRFITQLLCSHLYWEPIRHAIYGSHSMFDCAFSPKRAYRCKACGKTIVSKTPPVNAIGP